MPPPPTTTRGSNTVCIHMHEYMKTCLSEKGSSETNASYFHRDYKR